MERFRSLSLVPFLKSCDEDRAYKTFFAERPDLCAGASRLVDLGCGPASKIAAISWAVRSQASDYLLVDRDLRWQEAIDANAHFGFAPGSSVAFKGGDIFLDVDAATLRGSDVVLLLQVCYGDELATEFVRWIPTVAHVPSLWVVSAESHRSPTAAIRRRLTASAGIELTGSALPSVRRGLVSAGLKVETLRIGGKTLDLRGETIDGSHWLLDFLLGEDGAYGDLPSETQRTVLDVVRDEVALRGARMRLYDDVLIARLERDGRL